MPVNLIGKHQQKTYELMKKELKKNKKAAYIFPTGAGKTFPALKYVEENPEKQVVIVVPSLFIVNQLKKYIRKYVENGDKRLKSNNISIITYQKISQFKDITKKINPDLIIFDEIHRLGAEKWEPAADRLVESFPDAEVIGMTATPERTNKRNMAYEKFSGSVVYEMSLAEALSGEKEGEVILKSPKYFRVLSLLKENLESYKKRIYRVEDSYERERLIRKYERLEEIISSSPDISDIMQEAMKNKPNGKYIVFCKDKEDLKAKMEECQKIFGKVNSNINCQYVCSKDDKHDTFGKSKKDNARTIEYFENMPNGDSLNLLFCVDMLDEGRHIDGIDGEVLFASTSSKIVYKQRIGRVLSADKNAGETVIIDAVNNWLEQIDAYKELEEAIRKGRSRDRQNKQNEQDFIESDDLLKLLPEETELLEIMREIGELQTNNMTYIEGLRLAKKWCEDNWGKGDQIKPNHRLPSSSANGDEEKKLGTLLRDIKNRIVKQYDGIALDQIENVDHREIVEIVRFLDKNYMSEVQKRQSEGGKNAISLLESTYLIKDWCERKFGIGEKVSKDKRLPTRKSKDPEEKKLGIALGNIVRKIVRKYDGIELDHISDDEHRRIVEIIRYLNENYMSEKQEKQSLVQKTANSALTSLNLVKEWCEKKFGIGEKISKDKRLPSTISEDKEEKKLGVALSNIKKRYKNYENVDLSEIKNIEARKIVEFIRFLDENYMSEVQKKQSEALKNSTASLESINLIRQWCEKKFGTGEKISKDKRVPSESSKDGEEKKLGKSYYYIRKRIVRLYDGMDLKEISNEEHRKIVEISRYLTDNYMSDSQKRRSSGASRRMRDAVAANVGFNQAVRDELEGRVNVRIAADAPDGEEK